MINPGKLRHRLIIQRPVEQQDMNTGAMNTTWEDIETVWAEIKPISVKEFISAQAENSEVSAKITIRKLNGISSECRAFHEAKNKYYKIQSVIWENHSGLRYMVLYCAEGIRYRQIGTAEIVTYLGIPVTYMGENVTYTN